MGHLPSQRSREARARDTQEHARGSYMRRRWLAASVPALTLLFVSAWGLAQQGAGARYVPYQGQLQHGGAPVDGAVDMTFSFYASDSGGTALATVALPDVQVSAGAFAVEIGPVPDAVFDSPSLYLAVEVEGVPLPGRQVIRAVPYAMHGQVGGVFRADERAAFHVPSVIRSLSRGTKRREGPPRALCLAACLAAFAGALPSDGRLRARRACHGWQIIGGATCGCRGRPCPPRRTDGRRSRWRSSCSRPCR